MDRTLLIQGVDGEAGRRLLPWAKRLDLGVECVALRSTAEAVIWFREEGRRADLAFVDVESFLDATAREFWLTRQGGSLPIVVLGSRADEEAFSYARATVPLPENAVPHWAVGELLEVRLGAAAGADPAVWLWDPHERLGHGAPAYLTDLGFSRIRRARDLDDLLKEDLTRFQGVVAELVAGNTPAPKEWALWRERTRDLSLPTVALLGEAFIRRFKDYQGAAGALALSRVWDREGGPVAWDRGREELLRAVERGRLVGNFLREADVFLARGTIGHALSLLDHAVGQHPGEAPLWEKLADARFAQGDDGPALEAMRRAVRLEPGNRSRRARFLVRLETAGSDADRTIALREAADRFSWDATFRTALAELFRLRGDVAGARIESERARLLNTVPIP